MFDFYVSQSPEVCGNIKNAECSIKPVVKAIKLSTSGLLMGAIIDGERIMVDRIIGRWLQKTNSLAPSDYQARFTILSINAGLYDVERNTPTMTIKNG